MKRMARICWVAGAIVSLCPPTGAQVLRDVVEIGGQHYLRTQRTTSDAGLGWGGGGVAAQGGIGAYTMHWFDAYLYEDHDYLWTLNTLAEPLHDLVEIAVGGGAALGCPIPARWGDITWSLWATVSSRWGRVYDTHGVPHADPFLVASGGFSGGCEIDIRPDRVAALLGVESQYQGTTQYDQYLRLLAIDGTPLSDLMPVAHTTSSEERASVALATDGSIIAAYAYGSRATWIWHAYFQRVRPDLTVEAPVLIAAEESEPIAVRGLDDGSVLMFYRLRTSGTPSFVRPYAVTGQPLGDTLPIDPQCDFAAATHDGRFALAAEENYEDVWLRLYDAAGNPLGDRFYFRTGPTLTSARFYSTTVPLAYDDDGTLWIAWQGYQETPDFTSFNMLTVLKPFTPGDLNCDGVVNNQDIDGFVYALFLLPDEYDAYLHRFPVYHPCDMLCGDMNGDSVVNNQDIDGFVAALFAP